MIRYPPGTICCLLHDPLGLYNSQRDRYTICSTGDKPEDRALPCWIDETVEPSSIESGEPAEAFLWEIEENLRTLDTPEKFALVHFEMVEHYDLQDNSYVSPPKSDIQVELRISGKLVGDIPNANVIKYEAQRCAIEPGPVWLATRRDDVTRGCMIKEGEVATVINYTSFGFENYVEHDVPPPVLPTCDMIYVALQLGIKPFGGAAGTGRAAGNVSGPVPFLTRGELFDMIKKEHAHDLDMRILSMGVPGEPRGSPPPGSMDEFLDEILSMF